MDIKKFFFAKKNLSLIFIYLFFSSIFIQKAHANVLHNFIVLWGIDNASRFIIVFSLVCGFVISTIFYFNNSANREKIVSNRNLISSLLEDFWIDEFIVLKFTTFLNFLAISFFWVYLIFNGLMFLRILFLPGGDWGTYYLINILISPIFLILFRFLLETTIAIFKIAENTKINSKKY
tara:strand:- start:351 stop:884 length:534 start_codon:yes stop_codon:yes gene_type:complete